MARPTCRAAWARRCPSRSSTPSVRIAVIGCSTPCSRMPAMNCTSRGCCFRRSSRSSGWPGSEASAHERPNQHWLTAARFTGCGRHSMATLGKRRSRGRPAYGPYRDLVGKHRTNSGHSVRDQFSGHRRNSSTGIEGVFHANRTELHHTAVGGGTCCDNARRRTDGRRGAVLHQLGRLENHLPVTRQCSNQRRLPCSMRRNIPSGRAAYCFITAAIIGSGHSIKPSVHWSDRPRRTHPQLHLNLESP